MAKERLHPQRWEWLYARTHATLTKRGFQDGEGTSGATKAGRMEKAGVQPPFQLGRGADESGRKLRHERCDLRGASPAQGPGAVRSRRNSGAPPSGPPGFAHVAAGGINRRGSSPGRSSSPTAGPRRMALPGGTGSGRHSPGAGLRPVAADGLWRRVVPGVRHPRAGDGRGGDFRGPVRHVVGLGLGRSIEHAGLAALRAERTRPAQAVAEFAAPRMMRLAGQGTSAGMRDDSRGSAERSGRKAAR